MRPISYKMIAVAASVSLPALSYAQANLAVSQSVSVPSLNEIGLIALVAAVVGAAGWILKRRVK